jgi:hypothetical protein
LKKSAAGLYIFPTMAKRLSAQGTYLVFAWTGALMGLAIEVWRPLRLIAIIPPTIFGVVLFTLAVAVLAFLSERPAFLSNRVPRHSVVCGASCLLGLLCAGITCLLMS